MRRFAPFLIVTFALITPALAACTDQGGAVQAVEAYLAALVAKESDRIASLSCAEWEAEAIREVDALEAVEARLEGVTCREAGTEGDYTLVVCTGSLVLTYQGEDRPVDLSLRAYRVSRSGGAWLVCGYQE